MLAKPATAFLRRWVGIPKVQQGEHSYMIFFTTIGDRSNLTIAMPGYILG